MREKVKILLIEDNPDDVILIKKLLNCVPRFEYELELATTLLKACEILNLKSVDAVLIDLGLPDSQGYASFSRIHKHAPEVPIIIITGLDNEVIAMKAVREGAQDYLVKDSVDGPMLVRSIRYAMERKRQDKTKNNEISEIKRNNFPNLPEPIVRLADLAYNLWFSWHHQAYRLFRHLDIKLWEDVHHNPVQVLKEVDTHRLEEVLHEKPFMKRYHQVVEAFDHYMHDQNTWFKREFPEFKDQWIAYFSMEFGIHESLPIYSGGLGILAGDLLKSASDRGVPLVGLGLLYRESYFTQFISRHGHQQSVYLHNNFSDLPLLPVFNGEGKPLTLQVSFDHQTIAIRVWRVEVGRVQLYLLDTDISENSDAERKITARLYVEDRDYRLIQEMLLGIGGVKVLEALGIRPVVWHLNESHCAVANFERMRKLLQKGQPLQQAIETIRKSTLFTIHTPVATGTEVFDAPKIERFLKGYLQSLNIPSDEFFRLGQDAQYSDPNAFNMSILCFRTSGYANAVSELHGHVSRRIWHHLWPDRPVEEVPIGHITNGVHVRTWMASTLKDLLDEYLGLDWRYHLTDMEFWKEIYKIPDEALWKVHSELKFRMIEEVRKILVRQYERNDESPEVIEKTKRILSPEVLTIGFARRFTPYKRATLLFRNREWLRFILSREDMPVQIVFAGKAHPADQVGKQLIQTIYQESRTPEFEGKIVFVENYDMALAKILVSGVDVWLNLPRRPMEASGTSGMKAAINGVLHCSALDGWWREAYDGTNGWAVGEDKDYYNETEQDIVDSESLYRLLQDELAPLFYRRDERGIPVEWIEKMKRSMESLIPTFSTCRMLEQYVHQYYLSMMREKV